MAVREYEDGVFQFWIFFDRPQALLAVFCALGLVAGAAPGTEFLDRVDGVVVMQDLGTGKERLELFGDRKFAYARVGVELDYRG